MKDKYDENIRCSNCRNKIENEEDLHVDSRGMVFCSSCTKFQIHKEIHTIEDDVLGLRTPCNIPMDEYEMEDIRLRGPEIKQQGRRKINICKICMQKTIFFIWSTSRSINKDKLSIIKEFRNEFYLERVGYPICSHCIKENGLLVVEEIDNETCKF